MDVAERKFHLIFHTRWLSLKRAIDARVASLVHFLTFSLKNVTQILLLKVSLLGTRFWQLLTCLQMSFPSRLRKIFHRSHVEFTTVTTGY